MAAACRHLLLATGRITQIEIIYFCVLIPSIILHEISHGVVALAFGDKTAKRAGRLSLNPVRHVDLVGTMIVPAVLSLSGLGAYGWAKPVPVNVNQLRNPRNQTVWVSLVGPLTNFMLAAIFGVVFAHHPGGREGVVHQNGLGQTGGSDSPRCSARSSSSPASPTSCSGSSTCIPCPPLDGAAVLERFIPARHLPDYYRLQPVLMFLPFILLFFFRNQWAALINLITWWSGKLV